MTYSLDEWMVAWTPSDLEGGPAICVGPWPDRTGWSDRFEFTAGNCDLDRHGWERGRQLLAMMLDFHGAVVCDGIPPADAHREFLKIDAYGDLLPADAPLPDLAHGI